MRKRKRKKKKEIAILLLQFLPELLRPTNTKECVILFIFFQFFTTEWKHLPWHADSC
jgi:accessory gene regulator protein AgrB